VVLVPPRAQRPRRQRCARHARQQEELQHGGGGGHTARAETPPAGLGDRGRRA
jgi:hypothetical protein